MLEKVVATEYSYDRGAGRSHLTWACQPVPRLRCGISGRQTVPADRGGRARAFTRASATRACAADARWRGAMANWRTTNTRATAADHSSLEAHRHTGFLPLSEGYTSTVVHHHHAVMVKRGTSCITS